MRTTRYVAQAGVIAAVYAALTLIVLQMPSQLGWGPVQLRVSEAATVLACLTPAAVPGLFIGSLLANSFMLTQLGPLALYDVVFGSTASLLAAMWTWRLRERTALALAGPVVVNAIIVPAYLPLLLAGVGFYRIPAVGLTVEGSWPAMYLFGVVAVGVGQSLVVYGLGWPLLLALRKAGVAGILKL